MVENVNTEPFQMVENTLGIKVDGKTFTHMSRKWAYEIYELFLNTGVTLKCTGTHRLKMQNNEFAFAKDLQPGDIFSTGIKLEKIMINPYDGWVYDLVEIEDHEFNVKGIVNHNCEFLSSDELLVNSIKLSKLKAEKPLWDSMGFKFWKPEEEIGGRNKIYMVSLDPSTGSSKDYSCIEIFEFPSLEQVGEFRANDVNIPLLYAKLKWILNYLSDKKNGHRAEVLWTFERNGVGEAISALFFNDDKQPEYAELVNDQPMKFGVYTTGKQKVLACLQLKRLIEKEFNGLKIKSETLIFELKNFTAKGGGYEAKQGCTDDAVMAVVILMRLLKRLSEYNEEAFSAVNEYVDPDAPLDESNEPIPFLIM